MRYFAVRPFLLRGLIAAARESTLCSSWYKHCTVYHKSHDPFCHVLFMEPKGHEFWGQTVQWRLEVASHSNLVAFCFEKFTLAIPLKWADQVRGPPYLNALVLPTQITKRLKVAQFGCNTSYDLNWSLLKMLRTQNHSQIEGCSASGILSLTNKIRLIVLRVDVIRK